MTLPAGDVAQVCTFHVEKLTLGLDVRHVQEVLRQQEHTPVPLAPPAIRGLINLRGHIVIAIDLRHRLSLPPRDEPMSNVVLQPDSGAVSLLVDEIGEVVEIRPEELEAPPVHLPPLLRGMLEGVVRQPTGLLLLLNPHAAATLASRGPTTPETA